MKVINLIGQPSAGKSTTAAGLFFEMKLMGLNCELVGEYAKDMVWREMSPKAFADQIYITGKQNHRLVRLDGKVDYAVTDSPLILGPLYAPESYHKNYEPLVLELFHSYDNEVFVIEPVKPYNPLGRNQNEEEAKAVHVKVLNFLMTYDIPYTVIKGDKDAPKKILDILIPF